MLVLLYGWRRTGAPEGSERLRVALVQANVVPTDNMSVSEQKEHLETYGRLTREAATSKPALIAWPTSSLPAPMGVSRVVSHAVRTLARETGCYLLVGGAGQEKFEPPQEGYLPYSNSEFLIAPSGRLAGKYDKIRLLPFNEYIPLQGKIRWPQWITTLKKSYLSGKEYTLFRVSGAQFGAPICWENMFPDFFRRFVKDGAHFMVSVTNEGFWGRTSAPYQTLAMNVFRAVENRVTIVRATTVGVSAFINPEGEILERVQDDDGKALFVSGFLVRDVPLAHSKTFYTVHGDVFSYAVMAIAVLMILVSFYPQRWTRSFSRD
jgi:apolipoprotein N-acyltransferase